MAPHLVRWDREWKDKGLQVVEVELGQATPLAALQQWVEETHVEYPVLHDGDADVVRRYDVHMFPTGLLVDRNGKVVWHGFPSRDPQAVERAIRRALGT